MSTTTHRQGREKELQRRRALQTGASIITPDSYEILLTKISLITIANRISRITGKKLQRGEVDILIKFVRTLPSDNYYSLSLNEAQDKISRQFLSRYQAIANNFSEESDIEGMLGINHITDGPGTLQEYQKMEINQLTKNENQLKLTSFPNRRGNAVVDRARVDGNRSSPDSIKPDWKPSEDDMRTGVYKAAKMLEKFLDPESISEMFTGFRQSWTTFQTVTLPHLTIPLDSRNRLLTHTTTGEYKWNIHAAGKPGQLGDMRIQDVLEQVIQMKICPFWIPVNDVLDDYYAKVRLLIREFSSQSIQSTQFLNADETIPTVHNYHFEFEIQRRDKNRLYLVPVCNIFTFRKPFARVETLTTCFFSPFDKINLDADRVTCSVASGNPTIFTSSVPHNLATGDLVYVLNYASANIPTLNVEVNRIQGYIVTKIDAYNFSIPVDTTGSLPNPQTNIHVILGSKRIFFELEFTSLEE